MLMNGLVSNTPADGLQPPLTSGISFMKEEKEWII